MWYAGFGTGRKPPVPSAPCLTLFYQLVCWNLFYYNSSNSHPSTSAIRKSWHNKRVPLHSSSTLPHPYANWPLGTLTACMTFSGGCCDFLSMMHSIRERMWLRGLVWGFRTSRCQYYPARYNQYSLFWPTIIPRFTGSVWPAHNDTIVSIMFQCETPD